MRHQTAKIGSLVDVSDSEDPDGLRVFYYLVQDLKVIIYSASVDTLSSLACYHFVLLLWDTLLSGRTVHARPKSVHR